MPGQKIPLNVEELHRWPPDRVLALIQDLCRRWGIFGQRLSLRHEGEEYVFACGETDFFVYRRLAPAATTHAPPGWPVCLVTADQILDECTPPFPDHDHFACHLGLADWLTLIQEAYGD
jgi:hypothetical protein